MIVIHQSTASVAIDCLAKYRAVVIEGKDPGGFFAQVGTACHAGVEQGFIGTATGNREALDCALEGLEFWWQAQAEPMAVRVKMEAEKILRFAYSDESSLWLRMPGRGQKVVVEQRWAMDAEFNAVELDSPDVVYSGTIDYCEYGPKGVTLADHKTKLARIKNADLATDVQGWLYCLWALSALGVDSVTWKINMLRFGYAARTTFKRGDPWERVAKRLFTDVRLAVHRAEDADEWPATPGFGCDFCPIAHKCPAFLDLVEVGRERADEPVEVIAARYAATKKRVAADERKLKKYTDEHGPVPVGIGKVLGHKPGTRDVWDHPLADLLECLRADGATHEDLTRWFPGDRVSKDSMVKAATDLLARGELDQAPHEYIAGMRKTLPSTTFTTFMEVEEEKE